MEEKKMKNKLSKTQITTAIVLIFLMASSALTIMHEPIIASAKAYTPLPGEFGGSYTNVTQTWTSIPAGQTAAWTWSPIAYLSVSPGNIGKGQQLLVNMWTTPPPGANRCRVGYTVTFTKPDGTTDTVNNLNSYVADGTSWFDYYPDQVGNWSAVFTAPAQYFPAGGWLNGQINGSANSNVAAFGGSTPTTYPSEFYNAAVSQVVTFTVQQNFVASWSSALPTNQYWTRPISLNNREWSTISGNYPWEGWYGGASMNAAPRYMGPYITGSQTAHILWSQQQVNSFPAGIIGGETGQFGNKATPTLPSVVFEGRAYATQTVQWYNGSFISCAICYDLQTGKIYYEIPTAAPYNGITPTFIDYSIATSGEVLDSGDTNTYTASLMTLSGSLLYTINPATGAILYNVTAPPSTTPGTYLTGTQHNGYVISFQNLGNTTNPNYRIINWTTYPPSQTNGTLRILSNITSTFGSLGQIDWNTGISITQVRFTEGNLDGGSIIGYNLNTGRMQFNVSTGDTSPFNPGTAVADSGAYYCVMENMHVTAFSEQDGHIIWSTATQYPWGDFWGYTQASDGKTFIAIGYGGDYAFNETTGAIEWIYQPVTIPFETPYVQNGLSVNPGTGTPEIANGVLYIDSNEHTPSAPYERGFSTYAINMTDGSLIYRLDEPMVAGPMSDGYTMYQDTYDGLMYVTGTGPSTTTVSAPQTSITAGTGAIITGSVLDQSAAQPGTPCVSEASMGDYMSYIHLQTTWPGWSMANVTGVPVSIDAVDPNGNFMHLATVTSDATGHFGYTWTPTLAGDYKISATFGGSNSYGASWAQTYANVAAAQTATPTPVQTVQPAIASPTDIMTYTAAAAIAIIIAIAIATVLMIRTKRA